MLIVETLPVIRAAATQKRIDNMSRVDKRNDTLSKSSEVPLEFAGRSYSKSDRVRV